jgi:molybdopterin-guanine dinucleotide biosynthesis protein A
MGTPKAALEWHGSTLLYRAAALLARTVDGPVLVVASPGQELPDLPAGVEVVEDPVAGIGPLQGIATGLTALAGRSTAAFVCSTDMPFLHPAFVRRVLAGLAGPGTDVALPFARGFRQPLAAAYRTGLAALITALIAEGRSRPGMLYEHCAVARLADADLLADADVARFDPALDSLVNVNAPDDYAAARAAAPPPVTVDGRTVRAATVGALGLGPVVLEGRTRADPGFPLVAGDVLSPAGSARAGTRTGP